MGLSQSFKFNYNTPSDIENILNDLGASSKNRLWTILEFNKKQMKFEFAIEEYGLNSQRSGDYFEALGLLIEKLTEKFGHIEIDDV